MQIGIVTTWFERGGAYVSRAYLETLAKKHNVFIYARGGEQFAIGDPKWDGPNVRWTKVRSPKIDRDDFEKWIQSNQIRLVIFNEQEHFWPPILWAHKADVKTVAYVDFYTRRMIHWFNVYDALLCNTRRHYSVFKWHKGATYIPWGTDIHKFYPQNRQENNNLIFFHSAGMGGVNLRKGTDLLVRSFRLVKGPAQLIIHSQVPIEAYGYEIENLINTDGRIQFIYKNVPAPGLYYMGDVYVYPNRLDGLGLSVAEALACGLPVICTDVAPCNELIIRGVNGWCVPVEKIQFRKDNYYWPETECNILELTNRMQQCVKDRHLLPLWHDQARHYAEINLDWTKNSAPLLNKIDIIINSRKKPISKLVEWDIENYYSKSPSLIWKIYSRLFYS